VSIISFQLDYNGFEEYRCDKPMTLGINLQDFSNILKMAQNNDILTLKAQEENSYLNILFGNNTRDRSSEFQLNLLPLENEILGVPETDYSTSIRIRSSDFVRLCKDMMNLSKSVHIEVSDNTATFSVLGKAGPGKIKIKSNNAEKIEDQLKLNVIRGFHSVMDYNILTPSLEQAIYLTKLLFTFQVNSHL
jgi:proliferating cell nuclear antigen